ncbi:MAG TPA: hypothetical protein VIO16_15295, partial [Dehalococcoidia bacterium]
MPAIFISAVVSDGTSVLFEVDGEPLASATYSLPRFAFGDGEDSIEESLARQLREHAGIEANEQEFVDTLYERAPGSSESTTEQPADGHGVERNTIRPD